MAKFGKMVTEKYLLIDDSVLSGFMDMFRDIVNGIVKGRGFKYVLVLTEPDSKDIENGFFNYKINLVLDNPITEGRTLYKDRIIEVSGVDFILYNGTGYLDLTDYTKCDFEKVFDYDNAPEHQYQVYIRPKGKVKPYWCRHEELLHCRTGAYAYGTELEDLRPELTNVADYLFNNVLANVRK